MNTRQTASSLKDLQEHTPYGEYLKEILDFYVPLTLRLPALRDNPDFMQEQVKVTAASGITDVVTHADTYIQSEIKRAVEKLGHNWQFWGEEGNDSRLNILDEAKSHTIITDPIEGTNNFKRRIDDQWGSVIALVDNKSKEPVIGIVAHPTQRKYYIGVKNSGAYILEYDEKGELFDFAPMQNEPEKGYEQFTYNNSPHFADELVKRVKRFFALGEVIETNNLPRSRVLIDENTFEDPESGALEVIRYRGTIYFKTSNEMAAVFTILNELGGVITDGKGNPWTLGINTLLAARNNEDYQYLKNLYDKTA